MEDLSEHGGGEAAGGGVLLAGVIAGEDARAGWVCGEVYAVAEAEG